MHTRLFPSNHISITINTSLNNTHNKVKGNLLCEFLFLFFSHGSFTLHFDLTIHPGNNFQLNYLLLLIYLILLSYPLLLGYFTITHIKVTGNVLCDLSLSLFLHNSLTHHFYFLPDNGCWPWYGGTADGGTGGGGAATTSAMTASLPARFIFGDSVSFED